MALKSLDSLEPRNKKPPNVRAINDWIRRSAEEIDLSESRLSWFVASTVVLAALQRALHHDNEPRFLLKGGTYLEFRLGVKARATKDVDTLFRGKFDDFLDVLDEALAKPFDGIEFVRTEPRPINVNSRFYKPWRFSIKLQLQGKTWRKIDVEVSADEGALGQRVERFKTPSLACFGLENPPTTAGIAIVYQVAQKLHACTDPHSEDMPNDRVRDVVDLLLLQAAFYHDDLTPQSLVEACKDLFAAREMEATAAGSDIIRSWPPIVVSYPHWRNDYTKLANEIGHEASLGGAVEKINDWVSAIDDASAQG